MSVTFTPVVPQNATPIMIRQAYERLGLSLGIPPQVAQKIYKGQNFDNQTICKLYTREYNVYLMNMLSKEDVSEGISLDTLETTKLLEEIYTSKILLGQNKTFEILKTSIASDHLPHFLMALHLELKPDSFELNSLLKKAFISQFNQPTDEKRRMIKALLKNGAVLCPDFGHTILTDLATRSRIKQYREKVEKFDLSLFKWVVSITKESFYMHNLRDFLKEDHCNSPDELQQTVSFFLQNLNRSLLRDPETRGGEWYYHRLNSLMIIEPEEHVPQAEWNEEEKHFYDLAISDVVSNCLTFKNSDELLDLLQKSNLQGNCAHNLVMMLRAVDNNITIAPQLAQYFVGTTAQAKLENIIYTGHELGMPSQPCLDLLATCGASVDETFLVHLLDFEHADEAIALTLQLMTEKPTIQSLQTAFNEKRLDAFRLIINAGAIPSESLVHRIVQPSIRGEKPNLDYATLIVKSGSPISLEIWLCIQIWDEENGWDIGQTLVNAGATPPGELL